MDSSVVGYPALTPLFRVRSLAICSPACASTPLPWVRAFSYLAEFKQVLGRSVPFLVALMSFIYLFLVEIVCMDSWVLLVALLDLMNFPFYFFILFF